MQYYTCECGHRRAWGSIPPDPCAGCPKCGTLAHYGQREAKDHEFSETQTTRDGREVDVCTYCFRTRHEIEQAETETA